MVQLFASMAVIALLGVAGASSVSLFAAPFERDAYAPLWLLAGRTLSEVEGQRRAYGEVHSVLSVASTVYEAGSLADDPSTGDDSARVFSPRWLGAAVKAADGLRSLVVLDAQGVAQRFSGDEPIPKADASPSARASVSLGSSLTRSAARPETGAVSEAALRAQRGFATACDGRKKGSEELARVDEVPVLVVVRAINPMLEASPLLCGVYAISIPRSQPSSPLVYLIDSSGKVFGSSESPEDTALYHNVAAMPYELPPLQNTRVQGTFVSRTVGLGAAVFLPSTEDATGILVVAPEDQVFADVQARLRAAQMFAVVLAVGLIAVSFGVSRRLARPFSRLAWIASLAARGRLGDGVSMRGPREAKEAAHAFHKLRRELVYLRDTFDQRLEDSTAELQRRMGDFRSLFESVTSLVIVVDPDGRIREANAEALRVYGETCIGSAYEEAVEAATSRQSCLWMTLQRGVPAEMERRQRIGVVEEVVQVCTFPIKVEGELQGALEIARVVSEEKRTIARREHTKRMDAITMVAGGVADELKPKVTSVLAQLHLLQTGVDPDRLRRSLKAVAKEIQRVARMQSDLVIFARRDRDKEGAIDLNGVIGDVVRLLRYQAHLRGLTVEVDLAQQLPALRMTEDRLLRVLLEVGGNAIDALPQKGTLVFATSVSGYEVTVRVADDGPGISNAIRKRLFQPYVTTKDAPHLGLGLFFCRELVEEVGGRLELERTGGKGTVFRLIFLAEGANIQPAPLV